MEKDPTLKMKLDESFVTNFLHPTFKNISIPTETLLFPTGGSFFLFLHKKNQNAFPKMDKIFNLVNFISYLSRINQETCGVSEKEHYLLF